MKVSRRGLLGSGAAAAGVVGAYAVGREAAGGPGSPAAATPDDAVASSYPFRGEHQAGIVTPAQDRLHFAAFDVRTDSREELVALLKAWTEAAERMTRGEGAGPVGPTQGAADLPPDDTGEAIGLPPAGLTITFGFGPGSVHPLRPRGAPARGAAGPAALPGRQPGPRPVGRRPVHPGLRPGPAGRGARDPQPRAHRLRHGRRPLVPARLRPDLDHLDGAVDPAQPVRLQGRHRQRQGRGDRRPRRLRVGAGRGRPPTTGPTGSPAAPTSWPAGST